MKFFLVLLACVTLATLTFADSSEELKTKIENWHTKCQENPKSKVEPDIIEKLKKGEHVGEGHKVGEHARCMVTEMGLMEEDGTVNAQKIKERLGGKAKDPAKLDQLIEDCIKTEDTPEKTAVHIWLCVKKHVKEHH